MANVLGSDLGAALSRWVTESQVSEAARSRSRERWLKQQAAESTTLTSVLADLAERGRAVLVQTSLGRRHRGQLSVLGVDFVGLRTDIETDLLIARRAVAAVRTQPRDAPAHSGRALQLELHFADAIAAVGEDRPQVSVATEPNEAFNGTLLSVGRDVVTLRVEGATLTNVYIPIDAIQELALARPA